MSKRSQLQGWLRGVRTSWAHPLAKGRRFDVLWRTVQFGLWSFACRELKLFPWIGGHSLIGTSGYSGYFRNQLHEYVDLCFAAHYLAPGDFFVDAGANVGTWSLIAVLHDQASALAIEPAPDTLRVLRANIALNGLEDQIKVAPVALSDQKGTAQMHGVGMTRSVQVQSEQTPTGFVVATETLVNLLNARTPALIKLDLEGHELQALRGAGVWLSQQKVPVWCIEANTQAEAIALNAVMQAAGYTLMYYLPEQRQLVEARPVPCHQSNLIFVHDRQAAQARVAKGKPLHLFGRMI